LRQCMRIFSVCFCQINVNLKLISERIYSNLFANAMVRFTYSVGPNKTFYGRSFSDQLDVRFRTSNGRRSTDRISGRSTERISGRSRIIRITSSSDVQIRRN
jgi:hypothetical protein